jgi:membrane dipeptidase
MKQAALKQPSGADLHRDAIVIDGTCPLLRRKEFVDWYIEGGVTVCTPTVGSTATAEETLRNLGSWHRFIAARTDLTLVERAGQIPETKKAGKLGLVFHFQGADPIENDLDLVDAFHALGVRMVQLTYNIRNRVGDGCEEAGNAGLSRFGRDLVRRLNETRIIVDGSHTGERTTLEAIEASTRPFVFSHANAQAVHPCPRNISDAQIKAAAATGGLVGINGFPAFVGKSPQPTTADFLKHLDHVVELVGIEHAALGIDYYEGMHPVAGEEEAKKMYQQQLAVRRWSAEVYPPPPHHYPAGMATPKELPNLTAALLEHGYSATETRKILGENWLRVMRAVWGD